MPPPVDTVLTRSIRNLAVLLSGLVHVSVFTWFRILRARNGTELKKIGVHQASDSSFCGTFNKRTPKDMWTCPYCHIVFHVSDQKNRLSQRRRDHLNKQHPHERGSKHDDLREYTPVVMAVKNLPPQQVAWECPFCECCLPTLGKWDHDKAVTHHYRTKHPRRDTSRQAVLAARARLLRSKKRQEQKQAVSSKCRERNLVRAAAKRDFTVGNHQLVPLEIDPLTWPTVRSTKPAAFLSFFTCTKCRGVRRSGQFKLQCPGPRKSPLSAQHALWKRLDSNQQQTLAAAWGITWFKAQAWQSQASSRSKVSNHSVEDSWKRNLSAEGIEPNPGPSSLGAWKELTLNCGSRDATWAIVDDVCANRQLADVICLQETFLNPSSLHSLKHKLNLNG